MNSPKKGENNQKLSSRQHSLPLGSLDYLPLAQPDRLEGALPASAGYLLVSDGSALASRLVSLLTARGVQVAVLEPARPETNAEAFYKSSLPAPDDEEVTRAITDATQALGNLTGVICLLQTFANTPNLDSRARSGIELVFLTAKAVQNYLAKGTDVGRPAFLAVIRLDGELGLGGSADSVSAGAAGLVRSLSQEWPDIFCRVVDISPEVGTDEAAQSILAELEDADSSIVEVGIQPGIRQTPVIITQVVE